MQLAGGYSGLFLGWTHPETAKIINILNARMIGPTPIEMLPIFVKVSHFFLLMLHFCQCIYKIHTDLQEPASLAEDASLSDSVSDSVNFDCHIEIAKSENSKSSISRRLNSARNTRFSKKRLETNDHRPRPVTSHASFSRSGGAAAAQAANLFLSSPSGGVFFSNISKEKSVLSSFAKLNHNDRLFSGKFPDLSSSLTESNFEEVDGYSLFSETKKPRKPLSASIPPRKKGSQVVPFVISSDDDNRSIISLVSKFRQFIEPCSVVRPHTSHTVTHHIAFPSEQEAQELPMRMVDQARPNTGGYNFKSLLKEVGSCGLQSASPVSVSGDDVSIIPSAATTASGTLSKSVFGYRDKSDPRNKSHKNRTAHEKIVVRMYSAIRKAEQLEKIKNSSDEKAQITLRLGYILT